MLDLDAAAALARSARSGPNATFIGVCTDSRTLTAGDLFVALQGPRFDGHGFVRQALAAGAAGALVQAAHAAGFADLPLLVAEDTLQGLGNLAYGWRRRFVIPVIAVTGSNGKTTVKEMLRAILEAKHGMGKVLATSGNLNNSIGVPLTLLRLREPHRAAVVEMGMNHAGELRALTRLAQPGIALVNNAGVAHLGQLGSREAIAAAKAEIYEGLATEGVALVNADDRFAPLWMDLNQGRRVVSFGFTGPAEVQGRWEPRGLSVLLQVQVPDGSYEAIVPLPGEHNARNALAAAATAWALGIDAEHVCAGLSQVRAVPGRMQPRPLRGGGLLLDDSYNASPDSLRAAIQTLAAQPSARRILVLGDMGELGDGAPSLHAEAGAQARAAGLDALLGIGPLSAHACAAFGRGGRHSSDVVTLLENLRPMLGPDCAVLVKGSRFMAMDRVAQALATDIAGEQGH